EAAGDADRDGGLADVLEAFGEAGDLSLKYLLAALAKLLLAARHERVGLHFAQEPWRLLRPPGDKRDTPQDMARRIAALTEVVCANTVREQTLQVDVRGEQSFFALEARGLGKQDAVFPDERVAAEDDVGRGFPDAA